MIFSMFLVVLILLLSSQIRVSYFLNLCFEYPEMDIRSQCVSFIIQSVQSSRRAKPIGFKPKKESFLIGFDSSKTISRNCKIR